MLARDADRSDQPDCMGASGICELTQENQRAVGRGDGGRGLIKAGSLKGAENLESRDGE